MADVPGNYLLPPEEEPGALLNAATPPGSTGGGGTNRPNERKEDDWLHDLLVRRAAAAHYLGPRARASLLLETVDHVEAGADEAKRGNLRWVCGRGGGAVRGRSTWGASDGAGRFPGTRAQFRQCWQVGASGG
eukprot:gene6608-biopygen16430